jgi:hypothetical protein
LGIYIVYRFKKTESEALWGALAADRYLSAHPNRIHAKAKKNGSGHDPVSLTATDSQYHSVIESWLGAKNLQVLPFHFHIHGRLNHQKAPGIVPM